MSKGKPIKTQSYRVDRLVLRRLLAYNIGYALLEKAIAVTLGSTVPTFSTQNAKKARGIVIAELRSWTMEQLLSSLWANSNEKYSTDDIDFTTRKFPEASVEAVLGLIEGKQTRIDRIDLMDGAAIYDAKTAIAYLGPLYKDKFYGMLTTISSWATNKLYEDFDVLPCEELTNGVLVNWPSLTRDKGLTWATRPTEFPAEVFDELAIRAQKWEERLKAEESYSQKIEQDLASQLEDATPYMLPGTKVSLQKDSPKGYEPPPLPENGSLTWPKVLGMMGGIGALGNNFGSITESIVAGFGFWNLSPRQAEEVMRQQQIRMNEMINAQSDALDYAAYNRQGTNELFGIPVVVDPNMKPGTVALIGKPMSKPQSVPEPEPISPFDSKPRQFSFEEE